MGVDEADRADLEEALVKPEESEPVADSSAFYALVIGSDAREGDTASRSDVIILARVDPANATVTLVSIPRDTMITSSGSVEKINAAYNYGPASAVRAVSEFAGVDIAHYVEVDFEGLESVVDALGGVTVDIPEDIPAGNGGASFSAGEQTLTGAEALAYARERYSVSGGDFSRAQAQRQILSAIVQKVLAASPTDMPRLISQLAQSISTDLSVPDIISYALELQGSGHGLSIYSCITPSYTLSQDGVSYVATMYEEWRQMMQLVDAGLDPNDISAEVPQQQAEDERLGSASNAAGPRDYEALAADAGLTTADVPEPESAE
ncbi:LCP family protein [Olsenella profusa]|uniref:LCP family protein n=2 Tax=Olsenella profusa TaxID=138595 RepID=A0ABS2F2Z3_9ACTN|nr:LCP family protein [Olsenella profusa]